MEIQILFLSLQTVLLNVTDIQVEVSGHCYSRDFIKVRRGSKGKEKSNICLPEPAFKLFYSKANSIDVLFTSNGNGVTGNGFKFEWKVQSKFGFDKFNLS